MAVSFYAAWPYRTAQQQVEGNAFVVGRLAGSGVRVWWRRSAAALGAPEAPQRRVAWRPRQRSSAKRRHVSHSQVQAILRRYACVADVIFNFDLDACQLAYDGERVGRSRTGSG